MGKRGRRRAREQGKGRQGPPRILFPSRDRPLVEIHVQEGTPDDLRALCVAYWEFNDPGTWARNVSDIGAASQVATTVKTVAHASLLTVACPSCAAPITVTSRSEMAATGYWKGGKLPAEAQDAGSPCRECVQAQKQAQAEAAAHARERQDARNRTRAENAGAWVADHDHAKFADEEPDTLPALALLAMVDIMGRNDAKSFGPLKKASYTLTGTDGGDIEALRQLHAGRWIAPTLPATTGDFAFNDDDTVRGVYVDAVPWRLARWLGERATEAREEARNCMDTALYELGDPTAVVKVIRDLEAGMVVRYLSGLLEHKYREDPIPENRLPDAHAIARDALEEGFTLGQMLAIAWSAVSRSAGWGARTAWVKPGMVSSAAVTNLGKGVGFAKDRPVPEYDPPHWLPEPAALAAAHKLLERDAAAKAALNEFLGLHQRINARSPEAVDFHDELDEVGAAGSFGEDFQKHVDELMAGVKPEDTTPALTFAVVTEDGELQVKTSTVGDMKEIAGAPYGMVDRIMINGTKTLDAYIPDFADSNVHKANYVAAEMLGLLGDSSGVVCGTVAFFQTGPGSHRPHSLDSEHQELIKLAHIVAQERLHGAY